MDKHEYNEDWQFFKVIVESALKTIGAIAVGLLILVAVRTTFRYEVSLVTKSEIAEWAEENLPNKTELCEIAYCREERD